MAWGRILTHWQWVEELCGPIEFIIIKTKKAPSEKLLHGFWTKKCSTKSIDLGFYGGKRLSKRALPKIRAWWETARTLGDLVCDFERGCWVIPRQHLRALFSDSSAKSARATLLERGDASIGSEKESSRARLAACSSQADKKSIPNRVGDGSAGVNELGHFCPSRLLK